MIPMIAQKVMVVTTFANDFKGVLNKMMIDKILSHAKVYLNHCITAINAKRSKYVKLKKELDKQCS